MEGHSMIIFATIFGIGFLILVISLIFGTDHDFDVDADADAGHGHGIFSVKLVALLLVGFGATGFGARSTTDWSMFKCSMAGVGGAAIVGLIGWVILRAFYASQESSTVNDEDIIGQTANLIDAIGENQNGQIACIIRGREFTFLARSTDGKAIKRGTPVKIIAKTASVVTVQPIE